MLTMTDLTIIEETPQLLPHILNSRTECNPQRPWAKFPLSPATYDHGFRTATYGQIRNAVNHIAWMLANTLGPSAQFDTLAYMGPSDLRYHIVFLAAIKAGYKAFFPSPRNSIPAQKDLLSRLDCRILITTDPEPPFVAIILRDCPLLVLHIPSLDVLLQIEEVSSYPYTKSFEEARNDPILAMHSSGSTGMPKPMIYTNEFFWRMYKATAAPAPEGMKSIGDLFLKGEFFSFLPAFHTAGIGLGLVLPMYADVVPVLPLPGRPPSTGDFIQAVKNGSFDWAILMPVIIQELGQDSDALKLVSSKLKHLLYTGGALPPAAGAVFTSNIPLFSIFGSSECAGFPLIQFHDPEFTETWAYLKFHPAAGAEFRAYMDDLYELVVVKSKDHSELQPVFSMFPDMNEYETKDLFSPHPKFPGLWRHCGRRDDIIVFVNGEKTNPISFEEEVSENSAVRAALVAGNQRFEACLLVEPRTDETLSVSAKRDFLEEIWPTIESANSQCPAHARVSKSKILIVDAEKPMLRAGKGTVQRRATLQLYAEQIDALYSKAEYQSEITERLDSLKLNSSNARDYLCSLLAEITSWPQFQDDDDFFMLGLDSLQALQLSASVRSSFGIPSFTTSMIYQNPSIELLVKQIYPENSVTTKESDRTAKMARTLERYEQLIDNFASTAHIEASGKDRRAPQVIILTGSTGSIGSFVLNELLSCSKVSHVYCLNRRKDSGTFQLTQNNQKGLPCHLSQDQVTFLTVDLSKEYFGLDPKTYETLAEQATQIIHNAWPVDFNQPLQHFNASLDSLFGLIKFARKSLLNPSLLFLSSISSVSSYNLVPGAGSLVPENIISSFISAAPMGYGESKHLAERILAYASEKLSISCGVCRIGQVSGTRQTPRGWNRSEWLPSLILSSHYLKAVPDSLAGSAMDVVDWVPIDDLASILVELSSSLAKQSVASAIQVFNCVNPQKIAWGDIVPVVVQELKKPITSDSEKREIAALEFKEWLSRLRASETNILNQDSLHESIEQNPAIKLIDFYEQLIVEDQESSRVRLSTEKAVRASEHMGNLKPIEPELMRGWVQELLRG